MFKENMDAELYSEILQEYFFAFIAENYNCDVVLHQDNDPKHTSRMCTKVLTENNIKWVYFLKSRKINLKN